MESTTLQFNGWPPLLTAAVAVAAAVAAALLYRRETRLHGGYSRWALPLLRSLAVFLAVMALGAPVLHHEKIVQNFGTLFVFVDASRSMALTDEEMPQPRKLEVLKALHHDSGKDPLLRSAQGAEEAEFNALTRWQRTERLLLDPQRGLLADLADRHDIDLILLHGGEAETVWWRRSGGKQTPGPLPANWETSPEHRMTDLATGLRSSLGEDIVDAAVILVSDGQHNGPGAPETLAGELGALGVPVFSVGFGSDLPSRDMVLLEVKSPGTVFAEDVAQGEVVILDTMPAGARFRVAIAHGDKVLWKEEITAEGSGERRIEFTFAARELAASPGEGVQNSYPFALNATVSRADGDTAAAGEASVANNDHAFFIQAISNRPRILLVDGRPRWETRYLKNIFERDPRWEINALLRPLHPWNGDTWERGTVSGAFPESREELFRYDLIILGEVPPGAIDAKEAGWIVEFVEDRAGGLVFLDGTRDRFAELPSRELAALLPVARHAAGTTAAARPPAGIRLTGEGKLLAALRFADGESANAETWETLEPPRWSTPCEALPGSVALAETIGNGGGATPALVHWRVGRGMVLYAATDEFWRWRLGVGESFHERFWMQLAGWLSEPPYAVETETVSIASDRLVYDPGESAELRVRLRDSEGRFVEAADLQAVLYGDGREVAAFDLESDASGGGIYRGRSGGLAPGSYELAIRERGESEFPARLRLEVREPPDIELRHLHMNRTLLETMAQSSGGKFFLEEEASGLPGELEQMDRKEIITSDFRLWSSWWWFLPILCLLTAEWILRKRHGFI